VNDRIAAKLQGVRTSGAPLLPGAEPRYKVPLAPAPFFLPHTYLVGVVLNMKRIHYDLSPALHIAEVKVIELPSGISLAKFLMVFLT